MKDLTYKEKTLKEFEEVRCRSGSVGLKTDDLRESGFYNVNKCGICGRKWHIYEQAPICQKHRERYPDEQAFISQALDGYAEELRTTIDGYKVVDKDTKVELPHEDSCCNETIDSILDAIPNPSKEK